MSLTLSALNLVPIRQGSGAKEAINQMITLAQKLEALGFARYWIAEHHNTPSLASSATQVLIGQVLAHTQSLRVGSGGVMLPNHSPLLVAEQYGTLATMYPNRVDLGLGRAPGTDRATALALRRHADHVELNFAEDVLTVQRYLADSNQQGMVRAFPGENTHIPLYILGSSTESAYLAAELGLPYVFAAHFAPRMLEMALNIYRQQFQPSAALAEPYAIVALNTIVGESDEEARFLATSQEQFFLNIVRNTRQPLPPPVEDMSPLWTPSEEAMARSMFACSIIGSQVSVHTQLEEYHRLLRANEYMVVSYIYDEALQHRSYQLLKEVAEAL